MSSKVDKIVASEDDPKVAAGVVVNGTTIPCDFVIMGVGVAPATEFLKGSSIEIEKDGGIRVDQHLRVKTGKDTQNVFAIGMSLRPRCMHQRLICPRRHCHLSTGGWFRDQNRTLECKEILNSDL